VAIGDRAPAFTLPALNSGSIALRNFSHQVVVLNFWATWCPPCVDEAPSLEKFSEEMRPQGVAVIGVSVDQDPAALKRFVAQAHLTFPIARDPDQVLAARYGTFKFPETYIIDRSGRVAEKVIGPIDWQDPRIVDFVQNLASPLPRSGK
jgi:cytochrome c biogenesis protein CcmG/thiol:disulfide interchange protein DsbE